MGFGTTSCFGPAMRNDKRLSASPMLRQRAGLRGFQAAAQPAEGAGVEPAYNVLGMDLQCCCAGVRDTGIGTGFFRDGHCSTGPTDEGRHTGCI